MVTSIYGLIDPISGQVRYVGKSIHPIQRLKEHLKAARLKHKNRCCNWIRSLLKKGREPVLIILQHYVPLKLWRDAERFWVQYYKDKGCKLTNLAPAGIGSDFEEISRKRMSESHKKTWQDPAYRKRHKEGMARSNDEQIANIKKKWDDPEYCKRHSEGCRAAQLKKWDNPGYRENQRKAMIGKKVSEETRKKMSDSQKGRVHSEETRKKIGEIVSLRYQNSEYRERQLSRKCEKDGRFTQQRNH